MRSRLVHIAEWLLHLYCAEDRLEEVEGDLFELYESRRSTSSRWAGWRLLWDVLRSCNWTNIKKPHLANSQLPMFSNYLKIGYRNLIKDYKFATINLIGLSLGLSIFLAIVLMIRHELTFDHFHSKGDRIFHVIQEFQNTEGLDPEIFTALPLSEALRNDMPMVAKALTIHSAASTWMEVEGKRFFEEDGIVAGPEFFEFFDFPIIRGNAGSPLASTRSVVIDEQMADKLFGQADPIGQVVDIERYGLFKVTAVIEKVPTNSFIQFDFILTQDYDVFFQNVHSRFPGWFQSWEGDPAGTFVMLNDPADAARFEAEVSGLLSKYLEPEQINPHRLMNLQELHFGLSSIDGSINEYRRGDMRQLQLLSLVGLLILFMACFNFVNLVTARSIARSKEVGIRKSVGAVKGQIFMQFMTESFFQVTLAFILATGWIYLMIPYLQRLTGIALDIDGASLGAFAPYALLILVLVTFLSGIYPSLVLSRYNTTRALKAARPTGNKLWSLRNLLVVIQYGLVILMVSSLMIVNRQFEYMSSKPLGFDAEQLLVVEVNGGGVRSGFDMLKNDLLTNPEISSVSGLTRMIGGYRQGVGVYAQDDQDSERRQSVQFYGMDADGISTLGLKLLAGQDFQGVRGLDSTSVLLNETAAAWYGGESVLGEWIDLQGEEAQDRLRARVVGIVEDFHYSSLHQPIGPVVLGHLSNPFQGLDDLAIRINSGDLSKTLAFIEDTHNKYDENGVMTWEFLDDMVNRAYERELITRDIFAGAAAVAFFISLIGIIGLISFSVVAKTKELGIRKILGANYESLLLNQAKPFLYFLGIAFLMAAPLAWWSGSQWLNDFAYRADIGLIPFLIALALILVATVSTLWIINHRTIKRNPVEALRYE